MSIFSRFAEGARDAAATESLSGNDPLQNADAGFAQERQQAELNADQSQEQTQEATQETATNTNVDLPEGTFDKDPEPKGDTDVVVDADNTEATFDNGALDPDDIEDDRAFDDIERDEGGIEMMVAEMTQVSEAVMAIETYGLDKSGMAILGITGLLNSTALESLGLESFTGGAPDAPESVMAMEALGEKVKEKAAAISAKVISVVKGGSEKIVSVVEKLWEKASGAASKLTEKAWDATKSAAATVKAHPYATMAAVVTAMGAVAGIVMYAGGAPSFGAKADVMRGFMTELAGKINKINWPFGKMSAKVNPGTLSLTFDGGSKADGFIAAPMMGVKKLGWTQNSVKALQSQLTRAWDAIKKGAAAMAVRGGKMASKAAELKNDFYDAPSAKAGLAVAGHFAGVAAKRGVGAKGQLAAAGAGAVLGSAAVSLAIANIIKTVIQLVRKIVVAGFRMITAAYRALAGMVSGGEPAAA